MSKLKIAYFISPHGFGHAARSSAIMDAIYEKNQLVEFEIFTHVPEWFFEDSLSAPFTYHSFLTDIGLVQTSPMKADIDKTIDILNDMLPFDPSMIHSLSGQVKKSNCCLIICDIAPMGIAVARHAGMPSMLIENFTWDWIYESYTAYNAQIGRHGAYLKTFFDLADFHIQTDPICTPADSAFTCLPASRKPRTSKDRIRKKLGIPAASRLVMISMGGIPDTFGFIEKLIHYEDICFVIPGGSRSMEISGNVVLLPHQSDFFHPDLIHACDAVVGKAGYSLLSEVYHAGVPFGYVTRPSFRESDVLASYIDSHMPGFPIDENQFADGSWIDSIEDLLVLPKIKQKQPNGADQIADFILNKL